MAYCHIFLVTLLISSIYGGFFPPSNSTSLVVNQTEYVSACGVRILTFTATSTAANFYFDLVFTPKISNNFEITMARFGPSPGNFSILNAFDGCGEYRCNTTALGGCTLTELCGNQNKPWFVYVRSTTGREGNFSFDLIIRPTPVVPKLPVSTSFLEPTDASNIIRGGIINSSQVLSAFDLYTFDIPADVVVGTSLEILLVSIEPLRGTLIPYLNYGGVAFPQNSACLEHTNQTFLPPCEVLQKGTWGLTVQRTVNLQNYTVRVALLPGIFEDLQENTQSSSAKLRNVDAEAHYTYTVPAFTANNNNTEAQIIFVVENIVGGTVKMEIFPNGVAGKDCPERVCSSKEGCHIVVPWCQIKEGKYLVVVTALVVNDPFYPVQFTVQARTRQVPTIRVNAGDKFSGFLKLSEYDHYRVTTPGGTNWLDIEIYVDADRLDIPATMYIGTLPFPDNDERNYNDFSIPVEGVLPYRGTRRDEHPACHRNYNQSFWKRCEAVQTNSNGFLRLCNLQLDPCELERFNDGIYLTVFNNNQTLQQHTWTQNPFSYTIYTRVWSPHDNANTIVDGYVHTDYVHTGLKKAFLIRPDWDDIRITLSSNYPEIRTTTADTTPEIQYEIIYSQKNVGPWCNTCYRIQKSGVLQPRETLSFDVNKCVEHGKGVRERDYVELDEYVFLVIKGIENTGTQLNYTEQRYVITAKDLPRRIVNLLGADQFSNINHEDGLRSFGQVETWILDFDHNALYDKILSIKFRAHPRANRLMTLRLRDPRAYDYHCNDDLYHDLSDKSAGGRNCRKHFIVDTFACQPNDVNKGYCLVNFQICGLTDIFENQFDILNRVFHLDVGFTTPKPIENYTTSVPVEEAYSLTYNLIDQTPQKVFLNDTYLIELPTQVYKHYYVDVPSFAAGTHYFIIEAYFDSSAIFMDQFTSPVKNITLFINDPEHDKLAGDPLHSNGCLCHKNKRSSLISGTKKFSYVLPPCDVVGGRYRFSFYTDAHAYHENDNLINFRIFLEEYVRPLPFETLVDFHLYPFESAAFEVDIEPAMLTSNEFVDKEIRIKLSENNNRYGMRPTFVVSNIPGDCSCGVASSVRYNCESETDVFGSYECRLKLGFCQLDKGVTPPEDPTKWYIIVNYPTAGANSTIDPHQVVPMTVYVSRFNTIRRITPMTIAPRCNYTDRASAGSLISTVVESNEIQYFSVSFQGNGLFSAFVENITSGDVDIFFGNGKLPSPNPGCSDRLTTCREGSQACKLTTTCPVTFIGVRAKSVIRNRPVSFRVSSCATVNAQLTLNGPSIPVTVTTADNVDSSLSLTGLTNANFPMLVIFASVPTPVPAGTYNLTYTISSCGSCPAGFSRTQGCAGENCTIAIPVCDLPLNYASLISNINIRSGLATRTTYSLRAFSVALPAPQAMTSNNRLSATANTHSWIHVSWTLGSEVLAPQAGIQTSFMNYRVTSAQGGGNILQFLTSSAGSILTTDCPVRFTDNPFSISQCCTTPGVYSFAYFQLANFPVTYEFDPRLITQSTHTYLDTWTTANTPATATVNMVATPPGNASILSEVYAVIPAVQIAQYSTLIVQPSAPTSVTAGQINVYVNRDQQAGTAHAGCFNAELPNPVLAGGSQGFNATKTFFVCEKFPIQSSGGGFWVGFENNLNQPQTASVKFSVAQPIQIQLGVATTFSNGVVSVNQQFFLAPKENSWNQRSYRVNLTFSSGTTISAVYVNFGAAATPGGSACGGNIATSSAVSSPFSLAFGSCRNYTLGLPLYYFGVVTSSQTGSYTILVEEFTARDGDSNYRQISSSPTTNAPGGQYFFTATGVTNTSVAIVTVDGFSGVQTFNIAIFRDGKCIDYANSFCSVQTPGFNYKCTNFIPSCELKEGFMYHVVVTGAAVPHQVSVAITNVPEQNIPYVFDSIHTQYFEGSVETHQFTAYKFTLPSNNIKYGEQYSLELESTICGGVDAWGVQAYRPGLCVLDSRKCSTTGCLLAFHTQCNVLETNQVHELDFHVLVRGKAPVEFKKIQFRFKLYRKVHHTMLPFRYLEKHLIAPYSEEEELIPTCPAVSNIALKPCCGAGGGIPWIVPRTVYTMSVEGDQWLGYSNFHRLHLRLIDDRIFSGTLTVWNNYPSFCSAGPAFANNPGQFASCVADNVNRNCTVNMIPSNRCNHIGAHQFFFTVTTTNGSAIWDSRGGPLPTNPSEYWPVYSISHTAQPVEIVEVFFSEQPQYFRTTMAINEYAYYKVYHGDARSRVDFHFTVEFIEVVGGQVAIANTWNECQAQSCEDSDCRDYDAERPCNERLLDCNCKIELLDCPAGEIAKASPESYFQLRTLRVTDILSTVQVQIRVQFIEKLVFQQDKACDILGCADVKYYDTWDKRPTPEQLYRFRIRGVEKHTTLSIKESFIASPGYPSNAHAAECPRVRRTCEAYGPETPEGYKECETFYREASDGLPYATTNAFPSGGKGECSRAINDFEDIKNFRLNYELTLINPHITTLQDGVITDSTYFETINNCQVKNESYYYKFEATKGKYMVVEIWSTQDPLAVPETLQFCVTKDHIAYYRMSEATELGCTTQTALPGNVLYCRYILACDFAIGTYYIQVSDTYSLIGGPNFNRTHVYFHHKIRASTMNPIDVPLAHLAGTHFVLPYDKRQIVAVTITGANGNQENSERDLQVFVKGNATNYDTWLTRSLFGGANCAIDPSLTVAFGVKAQVHTVPQCWVTDKNDVFIAHIIRSEGGCNDAQISVHSRFAEVVHPVNNTFNGATVDSVSMVRGNLDAGKVGTLYKYNLAALGPNDVVYVRASGYDRDAILRVNLWRGNHIDQSHTTYAVQCKNQCQVQPTTQLPSSNVVWGDRCWHCGDSSHGPVFVRVDSSALIQGNVNSLNYNLQVQVTTWQPLTNVFTDVTFPYAEHSLAFFTMQHSRHLGTRVTVQVTAGNAVEVSLYHSRCSLRVPKIAQYYCFKGVYCEIPLPSLANFGSYYLDQTRDGAYLVDDADIRIVIRGFDSTFRIRQFIKGESCQALTTTNAPFCSTNSDVTRRTYWGEDESDSFIAKDRNAQEFYSNLTQAFTCGVTDHCDCPEQTQACRDALQKYACQSIFNPCNGEGLQEGPSYRTCRDVEHECGRTFICAGIPRLSCNHTFYHDGVERVDSKNIPLNNLDDPDYDDNGRARRAGIIALIVILIVLAVIILIIIGYIMYQRTSSLSSVVFDESKLGEYEAM